MDMEAIVKPYGAAVAIQLIYTGMFVISKAAFDQGMNTYVYIFYRQAVGSVLLLPVALVLQRRNPRSMSPWVLLKLFFCALIGITLGVNLYHVSLKFTSATVASAADSSLPAVTFFLAVLLRMENVKLKHPSGIAKLTSVVLCIGGVFTIAFFNGPSLSPINHHRAFASHPSGSNVIVAKGLWILWTFLMILSIFVWSLWMVLQTAVLKEYPNKMIVTATQCVLSTVQSFVVAVIAERDFSKWKLRFDISLLAIFYSGCMVTGVSYYLQTWCLQKKGPIFFAAWTPLCFVFTIFCSSFFLGEIVHLGSIVGGVLLVGSLYSMMWGQIKECKADDIEKDQHKGYAESYQEAQEQTIEDAGQRLENGRTTILMVG
ncbi:hypothetical protein ACP70R_034972 [Stipagrostis hirtigluma subsp. patula]